MTEKWAVLVVSALDADWLTASESVFGFESRPEADDFARMALELLPEARVVVMPLRTPPPVNIGGVLL